MERANPGTLVRVVKGPLQDKVGYVQGAWGDGCKVRFAPPPKKPFLPREDELVCFLWNYLEQVK